MTPCIMLYGRDSTLLWTRRMILEQAQFEVCTATEPAELRHALSSASLQLLVLCHSVPEDEGEAIRSSVHASHPGLKILILTASSDRTSLQDHVASTLYGPQTFLAAVHRLADISSHTSSPPTPSP